MVEMEKIDAGLPVAGPYSPAVKAGNLLFCSGQVAGDETKSIEDQTREVLEKLKTLLTAAGGSVKNIAKMTVYLVDEKYFPRMNAVYEQFFKDNGVTVLPARSTVGVRIAKAGILVEIDAFAVI